MTRQRSLHPEPVKRLAVLPSLSAVHQAQNNESAQQKEAAKDGDQNGV